MEVMRFLNKRKKENRQSLIIDNLNLAELKEKVNDNGNGNGTLQRRNSLNEAPNPFSPPRDISSLYTNDTNETNDTDKINSDYNKNYQENNFNETSKTPIYNENKKLETTKNYKKENESEREILPISKLPIMDRYDKPVMSGITESEYQNSMYSDDLYANTQNKTPQYNQQHNQQHNQQAQKSVQNKNMQEHTCNLCSNKNNVRDNFMILTCGHIYHIKCLVDSHYTEANKFGVIDEEYFNSRCCAVCNVQMEMEDILYIHNKFYKNTKEYLVKQEEHIELLDKQLSKIKEELRICYEYKQKLEHQREKSKQIIVTINTLM